MVTPKTSLVGRVAVVSGSGRGIGQAIAVQLAGVGARVALVARSEDELNATANLVTDRGGDASVHVTDVADAGQVATTLAAVTAQWGPIDVLVNNAATVSPLGASAALDPDEWADAITLNVTAVARLSFAVLPAMLDQHWGRVVNVSSSIAAHPDAMLRANAYATSKAALEAHTLNLAAELANTGITVNAYRPGGVDTAMQAFIRGQDPDRIGTELHQRFANNYEQGTLLTPDQSAALLLPLIATAATGQIWDAADPT